MNVKCGAAADLTFRANSVPWGFSHKYQMMQDNPAMNEGHKLLLENVYENVYLFYFHYLFAARYCPAETVVGTNNDSMSNNNLFTKDFSIY